MCKLGDIAPLTLIFGGPPDSRRATGGRVVYQARVAFILLFFGASWLLRATAQEVQPDPGGVEEAAPATRFLPDEKGKLVPVPGFSYEHYRDLVLQAERAGTDPPPFAIEKLTLQGTVENGIYRFNLEAVVKVRKAGWVMVPLRLPRAALRAPITAAVDPKPASEGEGEFIHRFDPTEGHVVWLSGEKDRRHTLRFPLSTQVSRSAGEEQLAVTLPEASDARLQVELSQPVSNAVLKTGKGLPETTSRDGRSQISVTGAAGDLSLTWRPDEMQAARVFDLDAASEIAVNVETRDTIGFSAKIHVSRAGSPVRRLFVRLPPQTELVPRPAREFSAAVATAEELSQAGFDPQRLANVVIARVDFEKPAESSDFALEAVFKPSAESPRGPLESAGFEILGAGRQEGFVSIYVPAGWSLKATPNAAAFRTDEDPTLLGENRASARYRFVRQPYSLQIEIAPQPPRTVVEPDFIAKVEAQRVLLAATLDYRVRGPRPAFVEVNLGGWRLDSAGPANLVDFEPPAPGENARLNLQSGASGEFTIQLQLHREVPDDNLQLSFGLPQAIATQALPATLIVATADNVALTPLNDELRALVQESRPQLPPGLNGRALVYRELPASGEAPRFVANCQVRKRRVTATIDGRVQLGSERADVEQNLSLQVAYEPLSALTLDAPVSAALADLKVTQNGQLLDAREEALGVTAKVSSRRWHVELLEPALGTIELNVRYSLKLPKGNQLQLPLVAPAEEEGIVTAQQQLLVESNAAAGQAFLPHQVDDPGLTVNESSEGLLLSWPRRVAVVELDRTAAGRANGPALRVEKQWLQIWLSPLSRRDRLVAQIANVGEQISVALPEGVLADDITVLVDGEPPQSLRLDAGSLVIGVAPSEKPLRTLEVWQLLPGYSASLAPQRRILELPRISGVATPAQSWVQILTPASEQVLFSPSAVTAEQSWRKQGWLWQRAGVLTTNELEAWSGASSHEETPMLNEALFMTLGRLPELEVVVWGRRWLWVCVAGGAFLVGLLAYYLSRGHLKVLAGILAALALAAALLAPELTLNVSQYAGVGLLLLIAVAWSLRVGGAPTERRPTPSQASTLHRAEPRKSESRSERRGSSLTTGNAALAPTAAEEARP